MRKHANKTKLLAIATMVVVVLLAILAAPVAACEGPCSVLWVGSNTLSWNDGSATVTRISVDQFAVQDLAGFGAIYVDSSAVLSGGLSILLERAVDISGFVSAGGGLITDNGGNHESPDFSWGPNAGSLGWVAEGQDSVLLTPLGATHPVTAGTTNDGLSGWDYSQHNYFSAIAGMDVLATNPTAQANVLAGTFGLGRLVYFGLNPATHQPWGDTKLLIRQAVAWACLFPDLPLVCNAGGPYEVDCGGTSTSINLDGIGCSNPDDLPSFSWSTNCIGGTFDDDTLAWPTLTIDTPAPCASLTCDVFLTVDDGTDSDSCQTTVTVNDITPPPITCPADTTIECGQSADPASTGFATATGLAGGKVYWTDLSAGKIQRANLDGSNVEDVLSTGLFQPYDIALDLSAGKMYWTDPLPNKIQRANLNGSHIEDLVTGGLTLPRFMALDAAAGNMYWTEETTDRIQRADLDGSNVEALITGLHGPLGIALDLDAGKIYWTAIDTDWIRRADLDGSNIENLITSGLPAANGIALDVTAGKMYWTDDGSFEIRRADFDGSNIEHLVTTGLSNPYGIAVDAAAGKMYWTDNGTHKVQRANLDGSNVEDLVSTGLLTPRGIALQSYAAECDPAPDVSFMDSVAGSCPQHSVITRSWTATDDCGNSSSCDQLIHVVGTFPLVCEAGGPYAIECGGTTTSINLDGSESSDPDSSDSLNFAWSTDCPGGTFDDNTLESPTLTIDTEAPCPPPVCNIFLTVDNGTDAASCQTTVTITDTIPPPISCPADTTIECDESTDPTNTGTANATVPAAIKMYWADLGSNKIQRADLDGSNVEDLASPPGPFGIAVDEVAGKMYWTEAYWDRIRRADLDGTNVEDLITGLSFPVGIALDVAAGKMYWTDAGTDKIQRADLDGTNVEDLVTSGLNAPTGIALDVAAGKMYWTDIVADKIQRADLNGNNVEDVVTSGLLGPTRIALDLAAGNMYWTSLETNNIQRADLDGANVEELIAGLGGPSGIALNVVAGDMYWTERVTGKLRRADLDGSNIEDLVTSGLGDPIDIVLQLDVADCDPDPEVNFIDSGVSGPCPEESVITRSWTATDDCGNSNTCDQIITVLYTNIPPICEIGGPYAAECNGTPTSVNLDGSGSSDPDPGDTVSFSWSTDCPGGGFNDNTLELPTLTLDAPPPCPVQCSVSLTVNDGPDTNSCQTTVTIDDTIPPPITCPADTTIDCEQSTEPANTGFATATLSGGEKLYWVDAGTDKIQRADLDGSNIEDLVTAGLAGPFGIALDVAAGKMYWAEFNTHKIQRADLDGSDVEDLLVFTGVHRPVGIALDIAAGKMYWTDAGVNKIRRANLDGSWLENLVTIGLLMPHGISLDTGAGKMYWTDSGTDEIKRADLDGSNIEDLVTTGLFGPAGIALDVAAQKMYWADFLTDKIQRADLGGSNIEDLVTGLGNLRGFTLDAVARTMYWTDIGPGKIQRADLDGSNVENLITTGLSSPLDIALQVGLADGCDPDPDVSFTDSVPAGSCPQESVITRTWSVTDDCGNSSTCDQIITVVDTTDPELTIPPDITIECDESSAPDNTGQASATDNCDDAPVVSFSDSVAPGECPQESTITRTWTAEDGCGNSTSLEQIITVVDTTAPELTIPDDITIECDEDESPANTGLATATDNCDEAPVVTFEDMATPASCPGTFRIFRTWTASDACGNSTSLEQIITVVDTTAPELMIPADITIECDEDSSPANTGQAGATDNCDDAPVISFSDSVAPGECPQESTITRTWTDEDGCGNSTSLDQIITVVDTTAPEISCPDDVTITSGDSTDPDATGMASATDNCDDEVDISFSDRVVFPDCLADPIHFTIERTWTATDDCDNGSSCMQIITVLRREVSLIIKQGACPAPVNPNSNGVVPMLLTGDADFDVHDVLLDSLRVTRCDCAGGDVAPNDGPPGPKIEILDLNHPFDGDVDCMGDQCACNADQSGDGIDDIWMKFRTDEMAGVLPLVAGEGVIILSVTGELDALAYADDGIRVGFMANDCVVMVPPGDIEPANAVVRSNAKDTFVEIWPLDINVDSDGFTDFGRAYFPGTVMSITAPKTSNGRRFLRWSFNGVMLDFGLRTIDLVLAEDIVLEAIYERPSVLDPDHPTSSDESMD